MRNIVAKHMNSFNRSSVVPNKRNKMLDELYEKEQYDEHLVVISVGDCNGESMDGFEIQKGMGASLRNQLSFL